MNNSLISVATLLLLASCGSSKPVNVAVVAVEPTIVAATTWPAGAPDYAPVYPGGTVSAAFTGATSTATANGMVAFTTADIPERVVAFYADEAKRAGLGQIATMAGNGAQMFSASDPASHRSMSVQASPDGPATTATLTYGATN